MTEITINQTIGSNVKTFRIARSLTAVRFAELVHEALGGTQWARQTVYSLESGNRAFAIAELVAMAKVLEVSLPDLIGEGHFPKTSRPIEKGALVKSQIAAVIADLNRIAAEI